MKNFIVIKFILGLCFLHGALYAQKLDRVLGDVIVKVDAPIDLVRLERRLLKLEELNIDVNFTQLAKLPKELWLISIDYTKFSDITLLNDIRNELGNSNAQYNRLIASRVIPNDPRFPMQWQFFNDGTVGIEGADADLDEAWDHTTGGVTSNGDTIVTCIIDIGFSQHEDLQENLYVNYAEIPDDGIDNDQNGFIDDYIGWNSFLQNDDIYLGGNHGLSVAGIVGAKGNNEIGITGVNWDAKLMLVNYGDASEAYAIAAMEYPYQMRKLYNDSNGKKGAFVVASNSSWGIDGLFESDAPLWCSFYNALGDVGIISSAATTNENVNIDEVGDMPTSCQSEFLISVTNITASNTLQFNAGFGAKNIDIGAYGVGILSLQRDDRYSKSTGTSVATPLVSGAISLLYSSPCGFLSNMAKSSPIDAARIVRDIILESVEPINDFETKSTSGGRLNVNNIIEESINQCNNNCHIPVGHLARTNFDKEISFTWLNDTDEMEVDIRYRIFGSDTWTEKKNINSGEELNGFDICSEYEYQVKASCNDQVTNDYHYTRHFISGGCCQDPIIEVEQVDNFLNVSVLNNEENVNRQLLEYTNEPLGDWDSIYFMQSTSIPLSGQCEFLYYRLSNFCESTANRSLDNKIYTFSFNCESCAELNYCESLYSNNRFEWIEKVTLGDFVSITGPEVNGYGAYLGKNLIKLERGDKIPFVLEVGNKMSDDTERASIFIDWNQDGSFSQEELVFYQEEIIGVAKDSIKIPEDAILGITRVRFRVNFEGTPTACDLLGYGETEDYCIEIVKTTSFEEELSLQKDAYIYPNPSHQTSYIVFEAPYNENVALEVFNTNGQLVSKAYVSVITGSNKLIIPNSIHFRSGIYLIRVNGKTVNLSKKMIKY